MSQNVSKSGQYYNEQPRCRFSEHNFKHLETTIQKIEKMRELCALSIAFNKSTLPVLNFTHIAEAI